MKGLLPSRLLKGHSGVKRLSKSLYRPSKLRRRLKRSRLGLPRPLLQVNPSFFEEEEQEAAAAEEENLVDNDNDSDAQVKLLVNHDAQVELPDNCAVCVETTLDKSVCVTKSNGDIDDCSIDFDAIGEHDDHAMDRHVDKREKEYGDSDPNADDFDSDNNNNEDEGMEEGDGDVKEFSDATRVQIKGSTEISREDGAIDVNDLLHVAVDRLWFAPPSMGEIADDSEVIEIEGTVEMLGNEPNMPEEGSAANANDSLKGPIISSDWEAAVSSVAQFPAAIVFICGGKNTGKSTFARYLVNSLLNRYTKVGFLDTDVGQPEFTPSGCLSLHVLDKAFVGLPALELKDPERCYFFGDTSPKANPEDYLKSVFSLSDYFKNKYIRNHTECQLSVLKEEIFPLIINTHGWIQGVGFDVLIKIIDHVSPTHVVQILSQTPSRNLPLDRFWDWGTTNRGNSQLLYINNALGEHTHLAEIKFDARELRDLRLLSYFQKDIKDKLMPTSRLSPLFVSAATALACLKPFQVPISAIKIIHQHFKVPECESAYSLNAALIGLGVDDEKSQDFKPRCVGLGIVRAVDVLKGLFYVITPLKLETLRQVNTFLQGRMEIPVSLLKAPRYISPYLCTNTISIEGTGSAVMGKGKKKALPMLRSVTMIDNGA